MNRYFAAKFALVSLRFNFDIYNNNNVWFKLKLSELGLGLGQ